MFWWHCACPAPLLGGHWWPGSPSKSERQNGNHSHDDCLLLWTLLSQPLPSSVSSPFSQQGIPFLLRLPESISIACIKEISSDSTALGQYLKGFLFSWGECGCTQKAKLRPKDENQDFQSTWLKKTFHPPEHAGIIKDWMSQRSVHKFS